MTAKHLKTPILLAFFALMIWVFPSPGYAEVKEIIAEGTYSMGDGETPQVAEERALLVAKQTALEQAGTYVESYSATKNYQLTADEVKVIASGIMQVTILDKSRSLNGNNINFWVKIKAVVTTDKIEDMAQKAKDNSIAEDYAKLQQDYAKSQAEISSLKQQLAAANTDSDKVRIRTQITASESTFQANGYFEQGNQFMLAHDYYNAVQSFSAAINMNSHFGRAYLRRGMAHVRLADYQAALNDFNTALEINPRLSLAYFGEGLVYEKAHDRQAAIAAFHRFLENSPPEQQPYINYTLRQLHYLERGEMAP